MKESKMRQRFRLGIVLMLLSVAPVGATSNLELQLSELAKVLAPVLQGGGTSRVAINDFPDLNGYQSVLGKFVAEELFTQLVTLAQGKFHVVERRHLATVLEEQQLSSGALFDPETAVRIGKLLNVHALIVGTITDLGSEIKINARVLSVESGLVIGASGVSAPKDDTVSHLLRQNPGASSAQDGQRRAGAPVQKGTAYFQNAFLRVTVESASRSADARRLTLALSFENVTDSELFIAVGHDGRSLTRARLVDDLGREYSADGDDITGISMEWSPHNKGGYSQLSARSKTTVVFVLRDQSDEPARAKGHSSEGIDLAREGAFSMSVFRLEESGRDARSDGRPIPFSVGISGVTIGN